MQIRQFEDKNLAHYSYAIISKSKMALIDPSRDPKQYYDYARDHGATIVAVIETHPHADFVSNHLEIHETTGATIYTSELAGAGYPHESFDEGDAILLGDIILKSINTPGHSPDSISVIAIDETGKSKAVFTGDTLFIGDCGRPDLREKAGAITAAKTELAKQMYHTLRDKFLILDDDVVVYPAHGAGSLCGKSLSNENSSTIGNEKITNWSLREITEEDFVKELLKDQPFIPKYFPFDVHVNKSGADHFQESITKVKRHEPVLDNATASRLKTDVLIIDTRPQKQFKKQHIHGSVNLQRDTKFETWLGSIVSPEEPFYMAGENEHELDNLVARAAKIGYEKQILATFVLDYGNEDMPLFDSNALKDHARDFTIVDVRNKSELSTASPFPGAIHIPLHELRERAGEIPTDKPIVVHCAGGYRSAAGSAIVKAAVDGSVNVFDLGDDIKKFLK